MEMPTGHFGSEAMPALEQHGSAVSMEGGLDRNAMARMDGIGDVGRNAGRPGNDSFPIVYKRRFAKVDSFTDSKPPRPSPIGRNEPKSAEFAVVQRKGSSSGALRKQFTLEQLWGQKLLNRLPINNSSAEGVKSPVLSETNGNANQTINNKPLIKRKRVEKASPLSQDSIPASDQAPIKARKQPSKSRVNRKGGQNQEGGVPLSAGEVPNKRRKVGRPAKEGVKRGRNEMRVRPAKRPKLVLGKNRKLEVEYLIGPKHGPQLVEFLQGREMEHRDYPAAHPKLHSEERGVPPESRFEEESSSGTQTEDDLPARLESGPIRQRQEVSSEATQSETATETDSDLPRMKGDHQGKRYDCEEEDDDSDGEQIPIDLNVLPELLMTVKSRRKKRVDGHRHDIQKPKRPALKRVEIHQQLQPLDQKKAVQTNQVVKSLWPIPDDTHESLTEEEAVDPISSNSGKFGSLKHLRSPAWPRKQDAHYNVQLGSREPKRLTDPVSKVRKNRVVQPKMPKVSLAQRFSETRLEKSELPMPVVSGAAGGKQREVRQFSSSEETESDREQQVDRFKMVARFPGVGVPAQSPIGLLNGVTPVGNVSSLPQLKRFPEDCPTVTDKAIPERSYGGSAERGTQNGADSPKYPKGFPMKRDEGRKMLVVAKSPDDSETESDNEIVGLGRSRIHSSPLLQRPPQTCLNQQNSEKGKGSGVLKARPVKNLENTMIKKSSADAPSAPLRSVGTSPANSSGGSLGGFAITTETYPEVELFSRKVIQRAKVIRSPQVRIATGVEGERALSRFSPFAQEKKRRQKNVDGTPFQNMEDAAHDHRRINGIKYSETIPGTPHSGVHTPLMRSPTLKPNNQKDKTYLSTRETGVAVKRRSKKDQIENGDVAGMQGLAVASKMTPRTRKLTDAMQKFVTQKANRRQWREVDLSKINPLALIGRTCKVFWPLDDEWYPGVIHDYNPQSKKHRIDYKDNEMEMVVIAKERVKLKLSPEEWVELETSTGEQALRRPGPDELAALATGVEDESKLGHGDLVWAKVKGYPMWPAFVMDEEHAIACGMEHAKKGMLPLQFFGSYDHCRFSYKKVVLFSKGLMLKFHTKCKRVVFVQGLEEVEKYLKECSLPDSMAHLLDDGDGVHGAIERQRQEIEQNWPEPDEQEAGDEGKRTIVRKRLKRVLTLPLRLGALTVLNLGRVVRDSEHFHDQQYIWPEGYTAIRRFPSAKDPDTIVDYKMQVLRNPLTQSLPMFRVSPADESPVEGVSPFACWKKFFQRLRRSQEKMGKSPELDKRMQFRSAAHMFGFSNPRVSKLIQALPNARACTKFTNWSVKAPSGEVEALLPAGYKPVDIAWKHLDRCTVCYLDEEYVDNLLLQCDKCRIMVHMNCYGELEPPDGDLWLCNLCRPDAPKSRPPCCLCPVTSGALKKTTDGRWAHLMCAMWIPETCLVDVKRMEPVDGINAISKERWRLTCSVCKVPYGACIQCTVNSCRTAFHPLCARSAGLCMEVLEEKRKGEGETDLRLLAYCRKHRQPTSQGCEVFNPTLHAKTDCLSYQPPKNSSGCARSEPYSAAARRGRREPEALAAALAKRLFVENLPYRVTGCRQNPPKEAGPSNGGSLWSRHWEATKGVVSGSPALPTPIISKSGEDVEVLSMSDKFRRMKSTLGQRLVFGKSAIHGMGVFTKQVHYANDMIIEYAGEVVRPVIADIRERRCYDSLVGAGTYMFRIDDERVVDATHAGSIAHLINHSCEPNCYSRTVTASGEDRIIIFAKRNIELGEELTYDYRFMSKDEVLTCYCGCAGCRGSVNVVDGDGDPNRMLVPLTDLIKLPATTRGHTH